jgi:hypothetical protein
VGVVDVPNRVAIAGVDVNREIFGHWIVDRVKRRGES